MKRILVTADGTIVNPSHITTAKRSIDQEGYKRDSFAYFRRNKEVEAVQGESREQHLLREALRGSLDKDFPKGKPDVEGYYRTQVCLSDGQILWVDDELAVVRSLMEQG